MMLLSHLRSRAESVERAESNSLLKFRTREGIRLQRKLIYLLKFKLLSKFVLKTGNLGLINFFRELDKSRLSSVKLYFDVATRNTTPNSNI